MLDAFSTSHRDEGLTVLALSVDTSEARPEVKRAVAGLKLLVVLAADASKNDLGTPEAVPVTYVVDREGVIRARLVPWHGSLQRTELEAAVIPLLRTAPNAGVPQDQRGSTTPHMCVAICYYAATGNV